MIFFSFLQQFSEYNERIIIFSFLQQFSKSKTYHLKFLFLRLSSYHDENGESYKLLIQTADYFTLPFVDTFYLLLYCEHIWFFIFISFPSCRLCVSVTQADLQETNNSTRDQKPLFECKDFLVYCTCVHHICCVSLIFHETAQSVTYHGTAQFP